MTKQRGTVALLVMFMAMVLTLGCLRCWHKSQMIADLLQEWKKSVQQQYVAEWLFDAGIALVKKEFSTLSDQVDRYRYGTSAELHLPDTMPYKHVFKELTAAKLLLKKPAYIRQSEQDAMLVVLQLTVNNAQRTVGYCVLKKVVSSDESKADDIVVTHYTFRAAV